MNQNGQIAPTVSVSQKQGVNDIQITLSGQELFYSKMKQTFESMVRKSQSDQLKNIHDLLINTDMVLRPDLEL